jgi:hypothetical protein
MMELNIHLYGLKDIKRNNLRIEITILHLIDNSSSSLLISHKDNSFSKI